MTYLSKIENEREIEKAKAECTSTCYAKPIKIWVESTSRCNLKCITCPRSYLPFFKGRDMDHEVFDITRRELFPFAREIFPQNFGEPMLSANFTEIFEEAIKSGASFTFTTNGMFLTEKWLRKFLEHNIHFDISLDGAGETTLKKIRPGANFGRIIRSIELFNELKEIEYKDSKAKIHLMCVALRSNIAEIPSLVNLAAQLNISCVHIFQLALSIHPPTVYKETLRHHEAIAETYLSLAKQRAEQLGVHLIANFQDRSEQENRAMHTPVQKCFDPWDGIVIRGNGDITPCCASAEIMGNLKKDGFWKVWNGAKYRTFRKRIHSRHPPLDCRNCTRPWGINAGNAETRKDSETRKEKLGYFLEHKTRIARYIFPYMRDYL